jgi:hypothetical protein
MTLEAFVTALVAMSFHLPPEQARVHVKAAIAAAAEHDFAALDVDDPVTLLLSVAYVESAFNVRALSRLECETADPASCTRETGVWVSATMPPKARPSWYCGPMQTGGYVAWAECQRMRADVAYGYSAGAKELMIWMRDPHCRNLESDRRLRCALAGYNAGYAGVQQAATLKYVDWVLLTRDRIVKFAEFADRRTQKPRS